MAGTDPTDLRELTLQPIGLIRTPFADRASAPRQPRAAEGTRGTIELFPGRGFEQALEDLEGWEYIWVLFWFHLNAGWRPKVLPPRSTRRRGLFSTRTPHRPNPLGISVVKLESVRGLVLGVSNVDMIDGTPVLDIKPYVSWADAIPSARAGWLEQSGETASSGHASEADSDGQPGDPVGAWEVVFADLALAQLAFLRDAHGVDVEAPLRAALTLGPHPHPYRRIKSDGAGGMRIAVKAWRARFCVDGRRIEVTELFSGYRLDALGDPDPALDAHRAFEARWGR